MAVLVILPFLNLKAPLLFQVHCIGGQWSLSKTPQMTPQSRGVVVFTAKKVVLRELFWVLENWSLARL